MDVEDSVNSGRWGHHPVELILGGCEDHPHQSKLIRGWGTSSTGGERWGRTENYWVGQKVRLGFPVAVPKNPNEPVSQPNTWKQERTQWCAAGRRGILKSILSVFIVIFVQFIFHSFSRKFGPDRVSYQFKWKDTFLILYSLLENLTLQNTRFWIK